ncbi:MAG: hypothetical protein ACFFG0_12480 [Candidatus Thorarchaeota archaeon]
MADTFKQGKVEGIILDPDVLGGVGDDYAQFCTYDEAVALKYGFEEEEPYEDYGYDNSYSPSSVPVYKINKFLYLKLIGKQTEIFVNDKPFNQCWYLLIVDPLRNAHQEEFFFI